MKRPARAAAALAATLLVVAAKPVARASTFAGAMESTQLANFFQLVTQAGRAIKQLTTLKRQLENMTQQAKRFSEMDFRNVRTVSQQSMGMYRSVESLYYQGDRLSDQFEQLYPGHRAEWKQYDEKMKVLDEKKRESIKVALKAADLTVDQVKSERALYDSLNNKLGAGELGRNELLEIIARTNMEMLRNLQELKLIFVSFQKMEAAAQAQATQEAQYQQANREEALKSPPRLVNGRYQWGSNIERWAK